MIEFYVGKIDKVIEDTYTIKFTVPNIIENGTAYPLLPQFTPFKDDEILIVKPESGVNSLFYYIRLDRPESFRIAANGVQIRFENGQIFLEGRVEQIPNNYTTESAILGTTLIDMLGKIIDTISKANYSMGTMDPASQAMLTTLNDMLQMTLSSTVKLQ